MYHVHVAHLGYTARTSEELAVAIRQLGRDLSACAYEQESVRAQELLVVELCSDDETTSPAPAIASEFSAEIYTEMAADLSPEMQSIADAWCADLSADTPVDRPVDWRALVMWALDDWVTGASSCWLAGYLSGTGKEKLVAVPHDGDDMQRCLYMIQRNPSLRPRLPMLADAGPQWARIWTHWAALETAFQAIPKPLSFDASSLQRERVHVFSTLFQQLTRQQD